MLTGCQVDEFDWIILVAGLIPVGMFPSSTCWLELLQLTRKTRGVPGGVSLLRFIQQAQCDGGGNLVSALLAINDNKTRGYPDKGREDQQHPQKLHPPGLASCGYGCSYHL